jgi:hypothetical protein
MAPEIMRKIVRRQPHLWMIQLLFGSHIAAEEAIRRYKANCQRDGRRYVRSEAIEKVVNYFKLNKRAFVNWLDRSKRVSRRP